jgi:hypothetical protein
LDAQYPDIDEDDELLRQVYALVGFHFKIIEPEKLEIGLLWENYKRILWVQQNQLF